MKRWKSLLIGMALGALVGALFPLYGHRLSLIRWFKPDAALIAHQGFLLAAIAVWVIFGLYWESAAKKVAAAKTSESKSSRSVHVTLTSVAQLLEIVPIHGLGRFVPVSIALMAAGLAVEVFGLGLAIWARRHLGRYWSGEITIKIGHELIRSGPYRRLRHPIYTGILAMYIGLALVTGEWLGLLGLALAIFAYWRKIRLEEANLEVAFGAGYDAYRRESWALLPGVF